MKKWNLFEFFSLMNVEQQRLPQLKSRSRISARRVRDRVMAQLPEEETSSVREHVWKFGRIPAVVTAAALVVSGSIVTAAAANGGFQNLYERFFGTEAGYTETVQNTYSVPDAVIENTLENVAVNVMGVFGDEYHVFTALDIYGINGYTLPENAQFAYESTDIEYADNVSGYSGTSWSTYEDGHLYMTLKLDSEVDVTKTDTTIHFSLFGLADHVVKPVDEDMMGYAMGWTMDKINQHKAYTAEEQQWIQDNFMAYCEGWYYNKQELLDCGGANIEIPVQYTQTETVQKSIVVDGIPMDLEITPWAARLTWDADDGNPDFLQHYYSSGETAYHYEITGYAVLADGTTTPKMEETQNNTDDQTRFMYNGSSAGTISGDQNKVTINFVRPVEPEEVTAIYDWDGNCIWNAEE